MKVAGIIAEYNPFHNGHAHHIAATRAAGATHCIVVLGSHFTQRGEPSLLPKAVRTRMALAGGADLVLELPQPWSCASAEGFARGGAALLHHTGVVDILSFGSESGDTAAIVRAAEKMNTPPFSAAVREQLKSGISYAAAQERALSAVCGEDAAALLRQPNNTLGVEYCRTLLRLGSSVMPFAVLRTGAAHDADKAENGIASASYIRAQLANSRPVDAFLPSESAKLLCDTVKAGHYTGDAALIDRILLSRLRMTDAATLAALSGVSEGLENRLFSALQNAASLQEVLDTVKTRRYTLSRLRRILTAAFLELPTAFEKSEPPYLRVLGIGDKGAELLRKMRDTATLPLFTDAMQPPTDSFSQRVFALECKASDLYGSLLSVPLPCGQEFTVGMQR